MVGWLVGFVLFCFCFVSPCFFDGRLFRWLIVLCLFLFGFFILRHVCSARTANGRRIFSRTKRAICEGERKFVNARLARVYVAKRDTQV